ncbi:MAG: class I SAM-dependent methyltransferase, partial [Kiloniellales bacterium]
MPEAREESCKTAFFGNQEIPAAEKSERVRGVFASVARRYDLMNDLMSGGVHRLWKRVLIDRMAPRPGLNLLDVAGGTGDIALAALERLGPSAPASITVCDLTPEMLAIGRARAIDRGELPARSRLAWLCGNAEGLPLADRSVEAYS